MSKHLLLKTLGLTAAMMVAGCEKDPVEPDHNNPSNPSNPQQPKTYTYYYDANGIPEDTLMAHTDVDTFYVLPTRPDLFATVSANNTHNIRSHLERSHNMNNKTFGKGPIILQNVSDEDSTYLAWFGYQVQR